MIRYSFTKRAKDFGCNNFEFPKEFIRLPNNGALCNWY